MPGAHRPQVLNTIRALRLKRDVDGNFWRKRRLQKHEIGI